MRPSSLPLQRLSSTALVAALVLIAPPALAQTAAPGTLQPRVLAPSEPPAYTLIHVNASSGSDTSGDGSQLRPYQTITHALQGATTNSIVLLAPGEYSEASGERFPIQLRTGVTVQGSPNGGLGQTVIRGSGIFTSTAGGMVHTTLVGADGAGLGHVTVTNTSTAGYGLVIEAGRPSVRQNQFVGSGYGGVYVAGNSAPVLEGNQFSRNGVVGLVLDGQTTAEVRGNRFEQTGIGIRVAPGAQPQIINNTIVQNQEGLLLDGSANPILQDNVIAQNRRNGVVEFQVALKAEEPVLQSAAAPILPAPISITTAPPVSSNLVPDLASALQSSTVSMEADPPVVALAPRAAENENAPSQSPFPAEAPSQPLGHTPIPSADSLPLALFSTQANPVAVTPSVAMPSVAIPETATPLTATPSTVASPADENSGVATLTTTLPAVPVPATPNSATAAPRTPPTVAQPSDTVLAARESLRRWRQARPSQGATATSETTSDAATIENVAGSVPIAVIPPPTSTVARASEAPSRPAAQLVTASSSRPAAPAQPSAPVSAPNTARPTNPDLLPVPSRTIPVGSGGSAIPNLAPPATAIALNGAPPAPPSYGGLLGLAYKVVVPAADAATQAQVRAAVADAFRVNLGGQAMMQVGAYADQATAEARANELMAQGFAARVEYRP